MRRAFPRFGHDVCDWARCVIGARIAREAGLRMVAADRLRAAAEFRRILAPARQTVFPELPQ